MLRKRDAVQMDVFGKPNKHFESMLYEQEGDSVYSYINNKYHQYRLSLLTRQIRKIAESNEKETIMLDLGCGNGDIEARLTHIPNLFKIGVDVSQGAIAKNAKQNYFDRTIVADVTRVPFKDLHLPKYSDIVVAAEILEHIQHPGVFIKDKIAPTQQKGGYFLGSVPNMAQFHDIVGLFTGKGFSYQTNRPLTDATCGHISFFSRKSLINTLSFAGYTKIKILGTGIRMKRTGDFGLIFLSRIPILTQFSDRFVFICQKS